MTAQFRDKYDDLIEVFTGDEEEALPDGIFVRYVDESSSSCEAVVDLAPETARALAAALYQAAADYEESHK